MTQYAQYDSTVAAPSPVLGWYDTDVVDYPTMPATADLLELTENEWAAHFGNPSGWAVTSGSLVTYAPPVVAQPVNYPALAQAALDKSDVTIIRCYEHAVAVPAAWTTYRTALRAIVSGASVVTALPAEPAYPAGT